MVYDVVIIGSGPAGLTAAIYTTRAALSTLIIGGAKWGGQLMLTTEVENFPGFPEGILGPDLMAKMRKQAEKFGAVFVQEDVTGVDFNPPAHSGLSSGSKTGGQFKINAGDKGYEGQSVVIATGADTLWLGLPSEQKFIGRGVSSCAPCDAPFFKNKNVIVVGGGDSAMEEALVLTKFATSVTIVHRRDRFRASDIMQKRVLENPKIKVLWNSEIVEILGDSPSPEALAEQSQKVAGAKIKNIQTGEISEMPIEGIFVAIGHAPSTKIFQGLELDQKGYVKKITNDKLQMGTSVPGVFVAGDVHDYHYRQAITAAGFGCQAAMDVERWIEDRKNEDKKDESRN